MKQIASTLAILLLLQVPLLAGVNFTVLGASKTQLGNYYELEFKLTSDKKLKGNPEFPDFAGFRILSGPNTSSATRIINRSISHTRSWTFVLLPLEEGSRQIGSARIKLAGIAYVTPTLTVRVSAEDDANGTESPELFLRAIVSDKTPYQGEQIIYQLKVYFRVNVQNYQPEDFQRTAGFIVEEFPIPRQPVIHQETIDGEQYNVAVIHKLALFPTVTGRLEIPPSATSFDVIKRRRSQRRPDIFDQFFSGAMMENYTEQRRLVTKTLVLDVQPLPEPAPEDFSGMVGSFTLQTRIDRTNLQTNEPLTFTATVKGQGNIKLIPEFELQLPHDIEAYPPKVESEINRRELISGFKRFKYLLVPRHPGEQVVKPLHFSFFDPVKEEYISLESKEISLQVERSSDYYPGSGAILRSGEPIQTYGVDIEYIRELTPAFQVAGRSFIGSWQYFTLLFLPWLLPLFAWGRRLFNDSKYRNRDMRRFRKARTVAARLQKQARKSLRQQDTPECFSYISLTLLNYLADKRGVEPAGLIWDDEMQRLLDQGIDTELVSELATLRQECDYARFAAVEKLPEAMAILKQTKQVINKLERQL